MTLLKRPLRLSGLVAIVIIPLIQVYSFGAQRSGWQTDLYWNAIFAAQGAGLEIALPAVGGFVAYRASFERAFLVRPVSGINRGWLRRFWRASWPAGLGLVIGTGITLYFTVQSTGTPEVSFNASVLVAFIGMSCTAVAGSYVLGRLFPSRASVVLAILLNYEFQLYPQLDGIPTWVRNLGGFVLWDSAFTPYLQTALAAIVAPSIIGLGALLALALVLPSWRRRPMLVPAALAAGGIAVAIGAASILVSPVDPRAFEARNTGTLDCRGEQPRLCLLPEQQVLAGATTRGAITATWRAETTAGVRLPPTVQSVYYDFAPAASRTRTNYVLLDERPSSKEVQLAYLSSIVHSFDCNSQAVSADDELRDEGAVLSLAGLVSGIKPQAALEDYAGAGEGEVAAVESIQKQLKLSTPSSLREYLRSYFDQRAMECRNGGH